MLKGQVKAQLTFLLVSLKLSRKQSSPRVAQVSRQAATTQKHVCSVPCCSGIRKAGILSSALTDTHQESDPLRVPVSPSVRRERKLVLNSIFCAQCSSPTGTENTREPVTDPDQHLSWCHLSAVPYATMVQQHRPCQDHCERFTYKLVCT